VRVEGGLSADFCEFECEQVWMRSLWDRVGLSELGVEWEVAVSVGSEC